MSAMDKAPAPKVRTVVKGEASESEEDEEQVQNSPVRRVPQIPPRALPITHPFANSISAQRAKQIGGGQAVVVAGEASESEEEEVDTSASEKGSPELPPLKVEQGRKLEHGSSSDLSDIPMLMSARMVESRFNRPKYDTLLHRKLRENNVQLHEHMVEVAAQTYLGAARSLTSTTNQLGKSHSIVQDISHSMRLLTNDLFHLDDRIDIIQSCKLLPDINIPGDASSAEAALPQSA